jgi:hypothetical protein
MYFFKPSPLRLEPLTSDTPRLSENTSTERHIVDLTTLMFIPSSDDDSGTQLILVLVADGLEERGDGVNGGSFSVRGSVHLRVVMYHIGNGLIDVSKRTL